MQVTQTFTGTIFYASKDAQTKRLYSEGRHIKTNRYHRAVFIEENFVQLDFDSTGTNYIHLALDA